MKNPLKLLLIFTILFVSKSFAQSAPESQYTLSKGKAGMLEIRQPVDDLYKHFNKADTRLVDLQLEGHFSPAIEVYLDLPEQQPSLIAEFRWYREVGWGVSRITIKDNRYKTETGIGIGSTFGDISKHHAVTSVGAGESPYLFAIVRELGMSFMLNISYGDMPAQWRKTKNQKLLPKTAKITSILVTGRPPRPQSR